jgi:hypothetical protein
MRVGKTLHEFKAQTDKLVPMQPGLDAIERMIESVLANAAITAMFG